MPHKDTAKHREYQRDLMRRRRADAAAESKGANLTSAQQSTAADRRRSEPQQQGNLNPGQVKTSKPTAEVMPADPETPGPQDQGKCVWSDKDICILFLSKNFKPIRCYGFNRICEGKPDAENTIPFKQCRENNDKTQQLAL